MLFSLALGGLHAQRQRVTSPAGRQAGWSKPVFGAGLSRISSGLKTAPSVGRWRILGPLLASPFGGFFCPRRRATCVSRPMAARTRRTPKQLTCISVGRSSNPSQSPEPGTTPSDPAAAASMSARQDCQSSSGGISSSM